MDITTNKIDLGKYQDIFKNIYAKYSEYWLRYQKEHSVPFAVTFHFGRYIDQINNVTTREKFFEHLVETTRNTPAFSVTMSHVVSMPDPVAGYGVHLIPDPSATTALNELDGTLNTEKWRDYLYHESGFFVAVVPLRWIKTKEEAESIVTAINQIGFEISGWINQLIMSDIVNKSRTNIQTFNLKSS